MAWTCVRCFVILHSYCLWKLNCPVKVCAQLVLEYFRVQLFRWLDSLTRHDSIHSVLWFWWFFRKSSTNNARPVIIHVVSYLSLHGPSSKLKLSAPSQIQQITGIRRRLQWLYHLQPSGNCRVVLLQCSKSLDRKTRTSQNMNGH